MKRTTAALIVAASLAAPSLAAAGDWKGDVNVLLAGKHLDSDWTPTEHQGELGLETSWEGPDWPIDIAADALFSGATADLNDDGFTKQRGETSELDLGVRKIWRPAPMVRPYLGGGLAAVRGRIERSNPFVTVSDENSAAGVWFGGGVYWTLAKAFNLGLDARVSNAEMKLFGVTRNAGGVHLGLLLGYHWGS